jgi:hypothetical protein
MDFNTGGGSGSPDDRPLYGDGAGRSTRGPARGPGGSSGGEFNLQDPINSFISTVRAVVLNPVGFFRGIARQGDFVNPLVFALICALISGVLGGIINFLISLAFGGGDPDFGVGGALAGLIANIILTPIFTAIGLFIGAGIYHLFVLLLVRPANAGFEATFRVVSYASVVLLVSWIPIVNFVAAVYGVVLHILGIREVHSTSTGRAVGVVLIPVGVLLLLLLLLGAALFALLIGSQEF